MKQLFSRWRVLALLVIFPFPWTATAFAVSSQTITGSGCATVDTTSQAVVGIQITGTWSGTIQPEVAIQGQAAVNIQVTPAGSTTAQSTITANGIYTANVAGFSTLLICGNTVTGNAVAWLNPTVANSGGMPGSGSGGVTSVAVVAATGAPVAVLGSPITSSGTITLTTVPALMSTFFAGPASGVAMPAAFRTLVSADLPNNPSFTGTLTDTSTNTFETFSQFFTAPWDGLQLTSAAGSVGSSIDLQNSNGTIAVPTALTVGQELGAITFDGYDGTAFSISPAAAKINAKVGENWTSSAHGTYILFNSTPDTTTSAVTRGLVDGLGNWEFGAPGGGPLPTGTAYAEFDINGNLIKPESTAPSGIASSDILYADSTAHRWKMLNNNTSGLDLVGIASAGTSGNCLQLATNGIDITDSGSACGGGGAVSSVFGRTGAVVATSGDYTLNQIGAPTATVGPWNFASNAMTFNWGAAAGSSQFAFSTTGAPAFQLLNPTSVAAVTNSPTLTIGGAYQNAGTPTFAADTWTIQSIIGSGTNGTSSLEYVHSGTTGAAGVYFPAGLPSSNIPGIGLSPANGTGSSGFGLGFDGATNGISFVLSGSFPFEIRSQQAVLRSNTVLAYTNGGTNGTIDTTLCRLSGGTVEIGSSTGCAASGSLSATNFTASGSINVTNPLISHTAPTISSGFGTGASVTANNGTAAFRINVGTSNTGNGVIGLPTATTGWNCYATDITTTSTTVSQTKTTGSTTATATLQNYTDISGTGAWTDSDVLAVSCFAY